MYAGASSDSSSSTAVGSNGDEKTVRPRSRARSKIGCVPLVRGVRALVEPVEVLPAPQLVPVGDPERRGVDVDGDGVRPVRLELERVRPARRPPRRRWPAPGRGSPLWLPDISATTNGRSPAPTACGPILIVAVIPTSAQVRPHRGAVVLSSSTRRADDLENEGAGSRPGSRRAVRWGRSRQPADGQRVAPLRRRARRRASARRSPLAPGPRRRRADRRRRRPPGRVDAGDQRPGAPGAAPSTRASHPARRGGA